MNAGFVGYYNTSIAEADKTLTMTVFTITDAGMKIERYDANGKHSLKSAGTDREKGNFNTDVINTQVLTDYYIKLKDDSSDESDTTLQWYQGQQLSVGNAAYRKAPQYTPNAQYASTDVIPLIAGETNVVNLGKYDQYTSARVLYVDANGYVIGATASFNAGKLVNVDTLALNGTRKGAVGIVLSVTLCKSASTASAAFDTVVNNTVITGSAR